MSTSFPSAGYRPGTANCPRDHVPAEMVADSLESAAIESVNKALRSAREKFEAKRWAARTAVALHAGEQQHQLSPASFETAIAGLKAASVEPLNLVFFVKGEHVRQFDSTE